MEPARSHILQAFPYPVAYPYSLVFDEDSPASIRRWTLCFTEYQLLRMVCLPLVCQYLTAEKVTEGWSCKRLNEAIAGIRCPFFSSWIMLLGSLREHLPQVGLEPLFPELAASLDAVQKNPQQAGLRSQTRLGPLEAIRDLRNEIAHGAGVPDQREAQKHLEDYLPLLHRVLEAFAFLGQCTLKVAHVNPETGRSEVRTLRGSKLGGEETLEPQWQAAFGKAPAALQCPAGQIVPLYPLFNPAPEKEPLFLYDGHFGIQVKSNQDSLERAFIYYMGTHHRLTDSQACSVLRDLLDKRDIGFFLDKEQTAPWTIADSAADYSRRTLNELLETKYFRDCYLAIPELDAHFSAFLQVPDPATWKPDTTTPHYANGLVVTGSAGAGKTAFLANQVDMLLSATEADAVPGKPPPPNPNLVLFLRGDGILSRDGKTISLFRDVAEKLGIAVDGAQVEVSKKGAAKAGFKNFRELFEHLHQRWLKDEVKNRKLIFVLDALNEAAFAEIVVNEALGLINLAACFPWCKVVFSTRQEWLTLWYSKMEANELSRLEDIRRCLYVPEGQAGRRQFPAVTVNALTLPQAETIYGRYQAAAKAGERLAPLDACRSSWKELSPQTQSLLTNPLHLHLFMKTFSGKPAGALASVPQLYRTYVEEALRLRPGLRAAVPLVLKFLADTPARAGADLTDNDVHSINTAAGETLSPVEARYRLNPVESLAHEGFISKRVREEGGGYRFVFQKVAEYLLYWYLHEGAEGQAELAYWTRWAAPNKVFAEYAGAFAFLFRDWAEQKKLDAIAQLSEAGPAWLRRVLVEFLLEQAYTDFKPGSGSEAASALVSVLEHHGGAGCAEAMQTAGDYLMPTQYAVVAERYWTAALTLRQAVLDRKPANAGDLGTLQASALCNLAWYYLDTGRLEKSKETFNRARALAEQVEQEHPENLRIGGTLAHSLRGLGAVCRGLDQLAEAEDALQASVKLLQSLRDANPNQDDFALWLAGALRNLAELVGARGRPEEAETSLREALEVGEELRAKYPAHLSPRELVAQCQLSLGHLLRQLGRVLDADQAYRRAHELFYDLWLANAGNLSLGSSVISALQGTIDLLCDVGRFAEAEKHFQTELNFLEDWRRRKPESVSFGTMHLYLLRKYGDLLRNLGRVPEAQQVFQKAVAEAEQLWQAQTNHHRVGESLIDALVGYGYFMRLQGAFAEAEKAFSRAIKVGQALGGSSQGGHLAGLFGLTSALQGLGNLYQTVNRYDIAEKPLRQAVQLAHEIWRLYPASFGAGQLRAAALENLASFLWTAGKGNEAEEIYENLLEFYESLHQQSPQMLEIALGLGRVLDNLGLWHKGRGQLAKAEGHYQRAIELLEPLQRAQPRNVTLVEMLANALLNSAELQWSCGQQGKASEAWLKTVALAAPVWEANRKLLGLAPKLAGAMHGVADFLRETGNLDQAEVYFRRSIDIRKELAAAAPDDAEAAMGPARPSSGLAVLLSENSRSAEAEKIYREQLPVLKDLVDKNPRQVNARELLAIYQLNLGWLLTEMGHSSAALELLQQATAHYRDLHEKEPQVVLFATTWAKVLNNLSIIQTNQGATREAEETFMLARRLCGEVRQTTPDDQEALDALGWTLNEGGRLWWWAGQLAKARACWQEARDLLENRPSIRNQQLLGRTLSYLAEAATWPDAVESKTVAPGGDNDDRSLMERGQALYVALLKVNARDVGTLHGRAVWLSKGARLWLKHGQARCAVEWAEQAIQIIEPLAQADPVHAFTRQSLAEAHLVVGAARGSKSPEAGAAFTRSKALLEELVALDDTHLGWKLSLARCLARLQQWDAAGPHLDTVLLRYPGNREALRLKQVWGQEDLGESMPATAAAFKLEARPAEKVPDTFSGPERVLAGCDGLCKMAQLLRDQGKPADALPLYQRALSIAESALPGEDPQLAPILKNLAEVQRDLKDYTAAEPLYRRVLAIRQKELGSEHLDIAVALGSLADLAWRNGSYTDAEKLDREILALREKLQGGDHLDVAQVWYNLGDDLRSQGKYAEAESAYEKALILREKGLGNEHALVAQCYNVLGLNYAAQNKAEQAQDHYEKAITLYGKIRGPEHNDVFVCLGNLARLHSQQKAYAKAETAFRRVVLFREKSKGPDHPEVATALIDLAECLRSQKKHVDAVALYRRALAIREKALGPDNALVALCCNSLGLAEEAAGQVAEAQQHFEKATVLFQTIRGPQHRDVATCLENLGNLFRDQKKLDQAIPLFQRALQIIEHLRGAEHLEVADRLNGLAIMLHDSGRLNEALPLFERSLAIMEKLNGLDHPDVAVLLGNIGILQLDREQYGAAEPAFRRLLSIQEKAPEHPGLHNTLYNFGEALRYQNKSAEAEPYYRRSLALREKELGPEHTLVGACVNSLALALAATGKREEAAQFYDKAAGIYEKNRGSWDLELAACLENFALLRRDQADLSAAEELFKRVLAIREKILGSEHPRVVVTLLQMGSIFWSPGQYPKAEPLLQRVLAIEEQVKGLDHLDVAQALSNLAQCKRFQGKHAEALPLYERALAIRQKHLGPNDPSLAMLHNFLGLAHSALKAPDKARAAYDKALAIREQHSDFLETGIVLDNLGLLLKGERKYAEAESCYRKSVSLVEKAVAAGNSPDQAALATTYFDLGECLRLQGKAQEALAPLERALEIREKVLGQDTAVVAQCLNSLGVACSTLPGGNQKAADYYRRAIGVYEKVSGRESANVVVCQENLADALRRLGQPREAVGLMEHVLRQREQSGSPQQVVQALQKLGDALDAAGDFDSALPHFRRAIEILEKQPGPDQGDLANSVYQLAMTCHTRKRRDLAREYFQRALALYKAAAKPDPYNVPACIYHLGVIAHDEGNFTEALALYQEALAMFEKFLPPDHRDMIVARESYNGLLRRMAGQEFTAQPAPGAMPPTGWWARFWQSLRRLFGGS
jgi:tetratricopeptide (TPR) repeat protein